MQLPRNLNPVLLGAEEQSVTMGQKMSTMLELWKISMTPGSPVADELSKDPKMKSLIKAYRLGTYSIIGVAFMSAVLLKRKKNKKKKLQALKIAVPAPVVKI